MSLSISHDLDDMTIDKEFRPVGLRAKIDLVVAHKDYFPFSATSKAKAKSQMQGIISFFTTDRLQWFALDVVEAYYFLCLGVKHEEFMREHSETPYCHENDIYERARNDPSDKELAEANSWLDFTHELCRAKGRDLFSKVGGISGFEIAEPCFSVFYSSRVLTFVSFRFSDIDRRGTGQILAAFEFHQSNGGLTNFYWVYSTGALGASSMAIKSLAGLAELIGPVALRYFAGR
jgi:hypothetical protein